MYLFFLHSRRENYYRLAYKRIQMMQKAVPHYWRTAILFKSIFSLLLHYANQLVANNIEAFAKTFGCFRKLHILANHNTF